MTDRGPGIAPGDAARVFDRFYRADSARAFPGSGLGLAIVRDVAEGHGGGAFVSADSNCHLDSPTKTAAATRASTRVASQTGLRVVRSTPYQLFRSGVPPCGGGDQTVWVGVTRTSTFWKSLSSV